MNMMESGNPIDPNRHVDDLESFQIALSLMGRLATEVPASPRIRRTRLLRRPAVNENENTIQTRRISHKHQWKLVDNFQTYKILPCLFCEYARTQGESWCGTFPLCRRKEVTKYEQHLSCGICDKRKIKKDNKVVYFTEKNMKKFETGKSIRKNEP